MQSMTSTPGGVGGDVAGGDDGVGAHVDDVASSAVGCREKLSGAVAWRVTKSGAVGRRISWWTVPLAGRL